MANRLKELIELTTQLPGCDSDVCSWAIERIKQLATENKRLRQQVTTGERCPVCKAISETIRRHHKQAIAAEELRLRPAREAAARDIVRRNAATVKEHNDVR